MGDLAYARAHEVPKVSGVAQLVALAASAVIGLRFDLAYGLTVGGVLALSLSPVWLPEFLRSRWGRALAVFAVLAVISGVILTQASLAHHGSQNYELVTRSLSIIQLVAGVGVIVWSSWVTSTAQTTTAFALGYVASIPFNVSDDPNLWRFTLSVPICVLLLALVSLRDSLTAVLLVIVGLAALGLANDSRSNSAFLLLTAVALVWQRVLRVGSRRVRGWGGILSLAAFGGGIALLLQSAILEGYFGEVTQARTAMQIERSGSALLGARPELAASISFILRYPLGLGSGIRANYDDVQAAKSAMWSIGYDPNNGYVERFMFGSGVELHSVAGNLWVWFGLAGVAFTVTVVALLLTGLQRGYITGTLTALFVYIAMRALWDVLFSPFASTLRLWPLVLALGILYISTRKSAERADLRVLETVR